MTTTAQAFSSTAAPRERQLPWWRRLYVQVIAAMIVGSLLGAFAPSLGAAMKPFGDGFVALIKMMIAPVVFCTIVHGIGSMRDMGQVGRIGLKALLYFEVVSTLALVIGLLAGHLLHPGAGFAGHPAATSAAAVAGYVKRANEDGVVAHLLAIIPATFVDAFAKGDLLQVLLLAILTGCAVNRTGEAGRHVAEMVDRVGQVMFKIVGIVVYAAPIGAFGAMAYTVGAFGPKALINLAALVGSFYLTAALFIVLGLGAIARLAGFSLVRFLRYIGDELVIVLGTSSSETVLPNLMRKLEKLGARDSVVGLVVPTGYSFNLDGTNLYMTLAVLFLAQATGVHLTPTQEATVLLVSLLTSKGSSGVTGAGFVTLAATLAAVPVIPLASLGLLLGVDRFMSQCRSITNLIGNGVATLVVARWEGALDMDVLRKELAQGPPSD